MADDPAPRRAVRAGAGRGRVPWLLGLALVLPAVLGACAQAAEVSGSRPTRTPSGLATAASTASAEAFGEARDLSAADPVERLRAALLGPGDLGPGWTPGAPPEPDPTAPAPCGGPGTVARFPDALRVGSTVHGPGGDVVQEALSVYGDADTARNAFRAALAGLACARGTLHGAPVTIAPAQDRRAEVGGDLASSWQVGSDTIDAVLVVVQARQAVFAFAYVTPAGAPPPDPLALSRTAVARALAA